MAKREPAAPARAAETVKAMSLYLVTLMPMLSAAMRLSRMAMTARPVRLFTRWKTTTRVMSRRIMPLVKVAMVGMLFRPMGPPMISVPSGSRLVVSDRRLMWKPRLSRPT